MKSMEEYDALSKKAAYMVMQALNLFKGEPEHIQNQAHQIIMQRVQRMIEGEKTSIEGEGLVREIEEPGQSEPINTP